MLVSYCVFCDGKHWEDNKVEDDNVTVKVESTGLSTCRLCGGRLLKYYAIEETETNHKGKWCVYYPDVFCQEGYCSNCHWKP